METAITTLAGSSDNRYNSINLAEEYTRRTVNKVG